MRRSVYLTFDVEDPVNDSSILALKKTLDCLKKENLRAMFFITGEVAEKLSNFRDIKIALNNHEIGYHSSSHSTRPIIAEYTDTVDYKEAIKISLKRETSHINSFTGAVEGKGGIFALRDVFPSKSIISFRAPGFSWSPPHLEALKTLGINYDFSADISSQKLSHKGITFFPFPLEIMPPEGKALTFSLYRRLLCLIFFRTTVVIVMHPHSLLLAEPWDAMYWKGNPNKLVECSQKESVQATKCLSDFKAFLSFLSNLQKIGIITVCPPLTPANSVHIHQERLYNAYKRASSWSNKFFNYQPKHMLCHFEHFFNYT